MSKEEPVKINLKGLVFGIEKGMFEFKRSEEIEELLYELQKLEVLGVAVEAVFSEDELISLNMKCMECSAPNCESKTKTVQLFCDKFNLVISPPCWFVENDTIGCLSDCEYNFRRPFKYLFNYSAYWQNKKKNYNDVEQRQVLHVKTY